MNLETTKIDPSSTELPWNLLLSADPSEELVQEYLKRGISYIATKGEEVIGVYVLIFTRPETLELVNVAVDEKFQGKGIGKALVLDAISKAKELKVKVLEVGTGNSSLSQLALYQKCGFRISGVDKDFFLKHYPDPIYENGILCRDMIRMSLDL
ncbi:GNAT family N-acetyltransferase [Leptospira sp. 201903070]|jgi:ribosomal protein S18 acetylase RimI-like enzyme|uniref:GNAT family N-acetyltransferase n=1 Tax=Leptospira ainlahdjerensis TaxID=2810033 RepID=A0ABS2UBR8_9LEPT|nr:GNAT family N-acetyltransferase [Leptospira ainlahdjerensis]MBM9577815.1 GNAT family N-acetyltransferase [Leptospira ainlahdjerensis]